MGREIRRVPKGWSHPRYNEGRWRGEYIPMFDCDFETAAAKWKEGYRQWEAGEHPEKEPNAVYCTEYWEYDFPPDRENHRPKFESEPTCYQVYQTVTEGTPTSPVFETEADLLAWLIQQGHSEYAARKFIEYGSVPSGMVVPQPSGPPEIKMGIDALDLKER